MLEHSPASRLVDNLCGASGKVATIDVDSQAIVREHVREPVSAAGCAGDVEAPIDLDHPDLDAARLARPTTGGRDVDGRVGRQSVGDNLPWVQFHHRFQLEVVEPYEARFCAEAIP